MVRQYGQELYKIAQFLAQVINAADDIRFLEKPETRLNLTVAVGEIPGFADALGLEQSALFVRGLVNELEQGVQPTEVFTRDTIRCVDRVFRNELGSAYFKHLNRQQASLYSAKEPFGEKVSAKFSEGVADIEEAAKCLALERSTSCVFHLMRTMELTVQYFGKSLGIERLEMESWHGILETLKRKIGAVPRSKRTDELNAAQALLHHVKVAWRNPIMHPRESYTLEQAHEIYEAVRAFTAHLANIL